MKIVPKEPTDDQLRAGYRAHAGDSRDGYFKPIYTAMADAAPDPTDELVEVVARALFELDNQAMSWSQFPDDAPTVRQARERARTAIDAIARA